MDLPVMPPIKPMLAKPRAALPEGDMSYEPKWDGFRCVVFRDGDEVMMGSRNSAISLTGGTFPACRPIPGIRPCLPVSRCPW